MSISNPGTFKNQETVNCVKFRWLVENCCEIILSNGKHILIDPCLPTPGEMWYEKGFGSTCTVDDIEQVDYVIINHTHGDHVWSIKKVVDKFNPRVIANAHVALQLAEVYHLTNLMRISPVDYGHEYNFGDFKLRTYMAQHTDISKNGFKMEFPDKWEGETRLNMMGSLLNMNFLITTNNNFKFAFDGGVYDEALNNWKDACPNLLIRHIDGPHYYTYDGAIKNMADSLETSGAQYLHLNCVQACYDENSTNPYSVDLYDYTSKINKLMAERGSSARVFNFKMGQWYTFSMGVTAD